LVALAVVVEIGNVQEAVDDAVACIWIVGGKGRDVGGNALLICYFGLLSFSKSRPWKIKIPPRNWSRKGLGSRNAPREP
jgi:hypothetical protein